MFLFPFHSTICFTLLLVDIFSCSYLLCVAPPPLFHTHTLFFKIYLCVQDSHIMEVGNQLFHVLFSQTTRRKKKNSCSVQSLPYWGFLLWYVISLHAMLLLIPLSKPPQPTQPALLVPHLENLPYKSCNPSGFVIHATSLWRSREEWRIIG